MSGGWFGGGDATFWGEGAEYTPFEGCCCSVADKESFVALHNLLNFSTRVEMHLNNLLIALLLTVRFLRLLSPLHEV